MADLGRILVGRKPATAGDPEWRILGDARRSVYLLHIAVNQIRVVTVRVVARREATIGQNSLCPGFIVGAHRFRNRLHPLDIEEDDSTVCKSFVGRLGYRVGGISRPTSRAYEVARARRVWRSARRNQNLHRRALID